MKTHWTMLTMLALCSLTAHAKSPKQPLEQWQTYSTEPPMQADDLAHHQAMVVFYRLDNVSGAPVNVYVNGHYQTTLLPLSHSVQAMCANKQNLGVAFSRTDGFEQVKQGVNEILPARETVFFRVKQNAAGQPELERVAANVAKTELANTKTMGQTLSRIPTDNHLDCQAPVVQTSQFSAQALFGFNQYTYQTIAPTAQKQLNDIAQKINRLGNDGVQKVVIAGHSDPEGSEAYNRELSQKRAQTIQAALQKNGGVSVSMEAVGLGSSELKVKDCAEQFPQDVAARQACNQPNRRVEITVYGYLEN